MWLVCSFHGHSLCVFLARNNSQLLLKVPLSFKQALILFLCTSADIMIRINCLPIALGNSNIKHKEKIL
jgi:hypothetical protein